ncbi:peptide deformylase [Nakamurella sp. UYEF19]|uniref:peptide deformylase n=1 Tax=Nakamurella sp. UYEF19 TaxID=1756392 RepID=UPI003390EC14
MNSAVEQLLSGPRPLPIVAAGDSVLRRRAEPYDGSLSADVLADLITAMRETMLAAPGVGLAAPQIGLGVQLAVLEDLATLPSEAARVRDRSPLPFRVLVNPSYRTVGDDVAAFYEGCLSVPGYQAVVERPSAVHLVATDENGAPVDEVVSGWAARIVAHETDHLHGTLYLDKAFTRSLTTNDNYLRRWATPTPLAARAELGF